MELFQTFWFGDELPPYQRLAISSFLDHGHRYALYAYRKFDVPSGTEIFDAGDILPPSRIFFYGAQAGAGQRNIAAFANLFRYHLLMRKGGWWVDTDVICLSGNIPSQDLYMGWEDNDKIGCAVLKIPVQHPLVVALCEEAERAGTDFSWGTTGPSLVTRLVRERGMIDLAAPRSFAYPVHYNDTLDLLLPDRRDTVRTLIGEAPLLHYWNEMLRRFKVSTRRAPPPESFMADLFARHNVGFADGSHTADEIRQFAAQGPGWG